MFCDRCDNLLPDRRYQTCPECRRVGRNGDKIVAGGIVGGLLGGPIGILGGAIIGSVLGEPDREDY